MASPEFTVKPYLAESNCATVSNIKMLKKQTVRILTLVTGTFVYLLIGAAVFDAVESESELIEKAALKEQEGDFKRQYNMSDEVVEKLRILFRKAELHLAGTQWEFAGAFYFALSVITTIGKLA